MWTWIRRDEGLESNSNLSNKEIKSPRSGGQSKDKRRPSRSAVTRFKDPAVCETPLRRAVSSATSKPRRPILVGCRSAGSNYERFARDRGKETARQPRQRKSQLTTGGVDSESEGSRSDTDNELEEIATRRKEKRKARRGKKMSVKSEGSSAVLAVTNANTPKHGGNWDSGSSYSSSASVSSRGGGPDLGLLNTQWMAYDDNVESFDEALRARRNTQKFLDPMYTDKSSEEYKKIITDLVERGIIQLERNKNVTFEQDPDSSAPEDNRPDPAEEARLKQRRTNAKRGWGIVRRKLLELKLERRQSNSFQGWAMLTKHARAMSDIERARADLYERYGFDESMGPGELPDSNPMAIKKNVNQATAKMRRISQMAQNAAARRSNVT